MPGAILLGAALITMWSACDEQAPPTTTGGGGSGVGGCEPGPPAALYTLAIRTEEDAPLPADTTISVRWSAGTEPAFVLGDESTHLTLEDGSNVVCELFDEGEMPRIDCELWTSGATEVEITALGYDDWLETLTPEEDEGCDEPVPSETEIVLVEMKVEPER